MVDNQKMLAFGTAIVLILAKKMIDNEKNRIIHRIDGFREPGGYGAGGDGNSYGC